MASLFSETQARTFRGGTTSAKAIVLWRARMRLRRRLTELYDGASAVMIQRYVDLAPMLTLEKMASKDRRLIYDIDDAVWLSGRDTGGHVLGMLKGTARKVRWLAKRAEHTIAGNEILAEHIAAYNPAVTVVPSLVDPSAYDLRQHAQGEQITLGWIGSPTTAPYLQRIAPVLERFAKQSTREVRLLVVGGTPPVLAHLHVEQWPWSPKAEQVALAQLDIGLMPLPDTPWTRGKCAYKALQYMAAGVPALVDDVGVSAKAVEDAGIVARSEAQWIEALHALADDAGMRERLGAAGRRRVERDFSVQRWAPVLARILRGV